MDGQHINIKCPSLSGSQFYNYKGNFSTTLLAIVDRNYFFFIYIDVGNSGRACDVEVLLNQLSNLPMNEEF
jgi:hypothetical protein